jgi:hypothetical protein
MDSYPLVLFANEPAAYRSLLASELPFLRPNLRMAEIHPADLATAVAALHPAVIVCSCMLEHAPGSEVIVLMLSAEQGGTFMQCRDETIVNPRLSDILSAIDHAVSPGDHDGSAPDRES